VSKRGRRNFSGAYNGKKGRKMEESLGAEVQVLWGKTTQKKNAPKPPRTEERLLEKMRQESGGNRWEGEGLQGGEQKSC